MPQLRLSKDEFLTEHCRLAEYAFVSQNYDSPFNFIVIETVYEIISTAISMDRFARFVSEIEEEHGKCDKPTCCCTIAKYSRNKLCTPNKTKLVLRDIGETHSSAWEDAMQRYGNDH